VHKKESESSKPYGIVEGLIRSPGFDAVESLLPSCKRKGMQFNTTNLKQSRDVRSKSSANVTKKYIATNRTQCN
jgi:hypothetical protein